MFEWLTAENIVFILSMVIILILLYLFWQNNKLSNALIASKLLGQDADDVIKKNVVAGIKEYEKEQAGGKKK